MTEQEVTDKLNEAEEIKAKTPTETDLLNAELLKAEIYDRFQAVFGGVYNVVELTIEDEKAKKVKSLIGDILIRARDTITMQVDNYIP